MVLEGPGRRGGGPALYFCRVEELDPGERENLETILEMFAAFNDRRPRDTEHVLDEFIVWDGRLLPVPGFDQVYLGIERVREFWRSWLPQWRAIESEIEWVRVRGDRVVAWLRQSMIGKESGVPVGMNYAWDILMRDGKLVRVTFILDRAEGGRARRHLGVERDRDDERDQLGQEQ